jgi:hypothetical protein
MLWLPSTVERDLSSLQEARLLVAGRSLALGEVSLPPDSDVHKELTSRYR